jgi:hypothetical protein
VPPRSPLVELELCLDLEQGAGKGRSPCRQCSRGFRAKRGSFFLGGGRPRPSAFFPGLRGRGDAATLLKLRASSFFLPSTAPQYDLRLRRQPRLCRGLRGFVGDVGKRAHFPAP